MSEPSADVSEPSALHLNPTAPLAKRVLLPGDPHRALAVAQELLDEPKMFNHTRGLWGYSGRAQDGELLTIQSTGMGGPSAAIVIEELIALGAETLVRIGTCGALRAGFELGDLVAAREVVGADGTSAALGARQRMAPDPELAKALVADGAAPVAVVTTDLFYDTREDVMEGWLADGIDVVEMEAATLLAVAEQHGVRAGVVLAVTDLLDGGERRRIPAEDVAETGLRVGRAGWAALVAVAAEDPA